MSLRIAGFQYLAVSHFIFPLLLSRPGSISAITLTAAQHFGNTSSFLQHRPLIYQVLPILHLIALFEHHT